MTSNLFARLWRAAIVGALTGTLQLPAGPGPGPRPEPRHPGKRHGAVEDRDHDRNGRAVRAGRLPPDQALCPGPE